MSADLLDYRDILDTILMVDVPPLSVRLIPPSTVYGLFLPTLASRIAISHPKYAVSVEFSPLTPLTPIRFLRTCFWHKTIYLSSKLRTLASLKWSTVSYHPRTTYPACTA